jgi:serine/threonine protein kinase
VLFTRILTFTATWLAPEVMRGLEYSIESDVYSFGITLWEITSREQAFAEYNVRFMSQLEDQILKGLRPYV